MLESLAMVHCQLPSASSVTSLSTPLTHLRVIHPKSTFIALSVLSYLLLVRSLRWRRYNALHRKYQAKYEAGELTIEDAQEVTKVSFMYDIPMLLNYSLAFALFKTYAIPTISKLLVDTKELGSSTNVSKRYADTEILIATWMACPISGKAAHTDGDRSKDSPESKTSPNGVTAALADETKKPVEDPRAMLALARVNWLHSKYNIKNDDYLYTLGLFIFEPQIWAQKFAWRPLSPLEKHAIFIYWLEIGQRMGIKDIPETQEAFKEWIESYEAEYMVPAETNREVASHTTEELLHAVPEFLGIKSFARRLTICACEERIRIAMMQPAQPAWLHTFLHITIKSISFIQYHFCLPRLSSNPGYPIDPVLHKSSSQGSGSTQLPRMHPQWFQSKPWYKPVRKTLVGRAVDWVWVKVGLYDYLPGEEWRSEGYKIEEMGPLKFEKSGKEEVIRMASQFYGGCPVRV